MSHHAFTFEVAGIDFSKRRFEDDLFEAGCDDATVVVRQGRLYLNFDREADSYDLAVASAENDVAKAGGRVVAAQPIAD